MENQAEWKVPLKLYTKLWEMYKDIDFIEKLGKNVQQKYEYVKEGSVITETRASYIKYKVFAKHEQTALDFIIEKDGDQKPYCFTKVTQKTTFIDIESGEWDSVQYYGTGWDKPGDKALFKGITGGLKYMLMKLHMIPSDTEPEKDNGIKDDFVQSSPKSEQSTKREQSVHEPETKASTTTCACGAGDVEHECKQADVIDRIKNISSQHEGTNWKSKHQQEIAKKKQLSWPGIFRAWQDTMKACASKQEEIF